MKVLIVDGNNIAFRAAYATPPLSHKGVATNAIRGFFSILMADISAISATHLVVAFDKKGPKNWRKKLYPEYKANRHKGEIAQEVLDIFNQLPIIRKLLRAIGVKVIAIGGEEADDIIGTLSRRFSKKGFEVYISSKDKDFAQLVDKKIFILEATNSKSDDRTVLDIDGIIGKYGVHPNKIVEFLALQGDSADNIPGVFRCGGITAAKLLNKYGSLASLSEARDEMTDGFRRNFEDAESLFPITLKLVTIDKSVKFKLKTSNCKLQSQMKDLDAFNSLCAKYNLVKTKSSLLKFLKSRYD